MKNATTIIALLIALAATTATAQVLQSDANPNTDPPTLYQLTQESDALPPSGGAGGGKTLLIFNSPQQARTWTTIIGYTAIAGGALLGGNAERIRMYEGTRSDWDAFHIQRDASLILTGIGSASLGASIAIGEKIRPLEIIWKTAAGAILYRITAQATYNATKP